MKDKYQEKPKDENYVPSNSLPLGKEHVCSITQGEINQLEKEISMGMDFDNEVGGRGAQGSDECFSDELKRAQRVRIGLQRIRNYSNR